MRRTVVADHAKLARRRDQFQPLKTLHNVPKEALSADLAVGQDIKTGLFLISNCDSNSVLNGLLKIGGPSLASLERALG